MLVCFMVGPGFAFGCFPLSHLAGHRFVGSESKLWVRYGGAEQTNKQTNEKEKLAA